MNVLVGRHEMLRAVVRGDGRQEILESVPPVVIGVEDLSGLEASVALGRVAEVRDGLSHEVREADRWPLFEVRAQVLGGGVWRVHLSLDLLVADAGSVQILLEEWGLLYADLGVVLPEIGCSFRDYVRALEGVEGSAGFERAREFWRGRLGGIAPAPELPLVSGGGGSGSGFVRRSFVLDGGGWARLRERAAGWGVTPSAVLAGVYAEVLGVWSKSSRFTLNFTVADRWPLHGDVGRLVGDFTSVLLVGADVSAPVGFVERVRGLQRQVWEGLEHRAYGGVRVLRDLAREFGAERAVMPVVFTSAIGRTVPEDIPGLGRQVEAISQTPQVSLDHQVYERGDGLVTAWDARADLFEPGLLDAMFTAYEQLVRRLVDGADEDWQATDLVPLPAAQVVVRDEVNDTRGVVPGGLLHERVFAAARRVPERDAVVWSGGGRMSFGELASRALRVGRRLREGGVGVGEPVVVSARKGWEQVVAVLGVLAAGGAYVPVDPDLPEERIQKLCARTGTRFVLTQSSLARRIAWPQDVSVWSVDEEAEWSGVSDEPLAWVQAASDLAYVIFTSGSTGEPKGVMIDHRGAVNTVVDVNERFRVGEGDRVLGLSSLSFDLSVWDIFGVLAAGGALVLPDADKLREPAHWVDLVRDERVTVWNSVPALFELFTEYVHTRGAEGVGLRLALLSGDWIPLGLPDRARDLVDGLAVVSLGGATEASIWSIAYPVGEVDPSWRSIPYGRPMVNQTFHVLDESMRPRPDLVPGELFIGGVGVALGYWGDEERTAKSFVIHPVTGERLYRTGDLGRYLPDGTIEFLGREDFQVKIGGYRIELGEIEAALLRQPGVETAVAHALGTPGGPRRLAAYAVPAPDSDTDLDTDLLRAELAKVLPAYMVPPTITVLDSLPLTANGKVDRKALPDPGQASARPFVPPTTPEEHTLTTIWTDLLALEKLGVHDNVFELGADSLLALRAVAAMDSAGLGLELRTVFDHPTVAEQALRTTRGRTVADQGVVSGPTGMTPNQLWFLSQDLPERHHWNDASFLLSLQRPLQADALRKATARILEHHDGLRLRFAQDGPADGWAASVAEPDPDGVPLSFHAFPDLTSREQKEAVTRTADRLQRSLDLAEGPIVRLAYFDLGERPHCLLVLGHWLAVDHYSARLLLEDLLSAYLQYEEGADRAVLPAKTTPFPAWTEALRRHAEDTATQAELTYWRDRDPGTRLRYDREDGPNRLESLRTLTLRLDHDLTDAVLREIPAARDTDILDTLLVALVGALPVADGPGSGERAVLVDLERHGRDIPLPGLSVARTVGRFSTITPTLVTVDPDAPAAERLDAVHAQLAAVPQQGAGYGLLRHLLREPALVEGPAAPVGLNYVGQVDEVFLRSDLLSVPRMSFGEQHSATGTRFRDLDVLGYVVGRRLTFTIGYSAHRFDDSTMSAFAEALERNLAAVVKEVSTETDED
ncbi:amino acid adenylation domain-containing protein [Streptomyces sp. NPDC094032]|uniref:amino acid adenylation domain-containing protein n=1 Tax=Streptomyces sp. NPDC094032 TaxID=3155308 RepID=UPI003330B57D